MSAEIEISYGHRADSLTHDPKVGTVVKVSLLHNTVMIRGLYGITSFERAKTYIWDVTLKFMDDWSPADVVTFNSSKEDQDEAFDVLTSLAEEYDVEIEKEEKGGKVVNSVGRGPKRIELSIKRKDASKGATTHKVAVLACAFSNDLSADYSLKARDLDADIDYLRQRAYQSTDWCIFRIEEFSGGDGPSVCTYYTSQEQKRAWERVTAGMDTFQNSEIIVIKNWDIPLANKQTVIHLPAADISTEEEDIYAAYGYGVSSRVYSGNTGYQQQCSSTHSSEFRVSGDEVGAKIILKRSEATSKKTVAPRKGQSPFTVIPKVRATSKPAEIDAASLTEDEEFHWMQVMPGITMH